MSVDDRACRRRRIAAIAVDPTSGLAFAQEEEEECPPAEVTGVMAPISVNGVTVTVEKPRIFLRHWQTR